MELAREIIDAYRRSALNLDSQAEYEEAIEVVAKILEPVRETLEALLTKGEALPVHPLLAGYLYHSEDVWTSARAVLAMFEEA